MRCQMVPHPEDAVLSSPPHSRDLRRYTKFKEAATSFASACGREPPQLKQRAPGATHAGGLTLLQPAGNGDAAGERLWDDDQTAVFYESLPDLVAVVPSLALERGQADDAADEAVAETAEASEGAAGARRSLKVAGCAVWLCRAPARRGGAVGC